ncbi:MAG: hypothetical protein ACRYGK_16640 [Janthinobacterium lividum]
MPPASSSAKLSAPGSPQPDQGEYLQAGCERTARIEPVEAILSWNALLPNAGSHGRNDPIVLARNAFAALGELATLQIHITDEWLAMQRGRYNDAGDALLRAMLTVFQHGSPEADSSCTFDTVTKYLEYDFLYLGHRYHVRARILNDGAVVDIEITDAVPLLLCLHLNLQCDFNKTSAAYKRLPPPRSSSSPSLYRMLQTGSRMAGGQGQALAHVDTTPARMALLDHWLATGSRVVLDDILNDIDGANLKVDHQILAYHDLFMLAKTRAGKNMLLEAFTGKATAKRKPYSVTLGASPAAMNARKLRLLANFAFASLAARRLLADSDELATATDLTLASTAEAAGMAGTAADGADDQNDDGNEDGAGAPMQIDVAIITACLDRCLAADAQVHLERSAQLSTMGSYVPAHLRAARDIARESDELKQRLAQKQARAAALRRKQQRQMNDEGQ